jgi:hypothetical protein
LCQAKSPKEVGHEEEREPLRTEPNPQDGLLLVVPHLCLVPVSAL